MQRESKTGRNEGNILIESRQNHGEIPQLCCRRVRHRPLSQRRLALRQFASRQVYNDQSRRILTTTWNQIVPSEMSMRVWRAALCVGAKPMHVFSDLYLAGPIRTSQEEHPILPVIVLDYFGNCATLCLRADLESGATCSIHRPLRDYGVERNYELLRKDTTNKAKRTIGAIRVESVRKCNPSGHHEK